MIQALERITVVPYTVQGIELDASGAVSPGWFSRIFEMTRWKVFAMDEFSLRYRLEGGVARAGTYEYGVPLTYRDELEIQTWVARVGRTSFDFGHRITRMNDGAVAASARMAVVNLGPDGPAPLDPDVAGFVVDEPTPSVRPWPEGERTNSWKRQWTVRPSDQDSFRHVNQARYVDYIDDTRWFAAKAGQAAGLEGPLAGLSVEYLRETHAGQQVQMETWVTGEGECAYELTRLPSGEILSRGQATLSAR
ncbi:MAG: thioesterase family protein [Polyangiales bacterium]